MVTFNAELNIGARVLVDSDKSLIGTVTAVLFRMGSTVYEVSYVMNGTPQSPYIESWRVRLAPN